MQGIEVVDDKDMYVLYSNDGFKSKFDYFDKVTKMKMKTVEVMTAEGETQTTEYRYSNYADQGGIMMPGRIQIAMGPMVLEGEVKSFKLNEKLSLDAFK